MHSLNGLDHLTVTARDAARSDRLTVLLILQREPFRPLLEYFRERNFSLASEEVYARAIGQLIDFLAARGNLYRDVEQRPQFFNGFAHALKHGTIAAGHDPTGLWWVPRSTDNVRKLLAAALEFSDWLVLKADATSLNPWRKASYAEEMAFLRRWNRASANSLLKHLKTNPDINSVQSARRNAFPTSRPSRVDTPPPAFPEKLFPKFLYDGFIRPGRAASAKPHLRQNLRDMLITLLMHGGGLRVSEPFHIFVEDIFEDPNDNSIAHVRVFHPSDGMMDVEDPLLGPRKINREAYLKIHHGRTPLDQVGKRTGWKNNHVNPNGLFMPVYWFPTDYGRLFLKLFRMYIEYTRPPSPEPWLFLTESGLPMTAKAFAQQYAAAARRLDIHPRKADGTTPHGHRHAYGQRLAEAKRQGLIDEKAVQLCLHHRSPASQNVYTQLSISEITYTLDRASELLFPERSEPNTNSHLAIFPN
ncbi:gamma-mobile-trio recombinase GmtY [Bosea sp. NPDC055353]